MFISLLMGYGKSLCYQVLPILFDALRGHRYAQFHGEQTASIVKDQVSDVNDRQLKAIHITTSMDEDQREALMSRQYSLVYISPEEFTLITVHLGTH